jgi:predicted transglutaminase-like cysteine proteinase
MQSDSLLERVFCGRLIRTRDANEQTNAILGQQIAVLEADKQNLQREMNELVAGAAQSKQENLARIASLSKEVSDLTSEISRLRAQLNSQQPIDPKQSLTFGYLPAGTQALATAYMNKYPEAYVTYGGRYWGTNRNRYRLDAKVWLLEGQNDWEIVSMVKAAKGRVQDVLAEKPDIGFHEACDIAFMRVTHALGDSIPYQFDDRSWGENEFWQFASETRIMKTGDCEDKAILNHVGARIAGIPYELLRVTAGMTFSNEGHATTFYLASDLKWHHRNSTTNYSAGKDAKSLPLTGDGSESLNIAQPWFSSTDTKTFNWFGTDAQRTKARRLQRQPFFKFIRINGGRP